MSIQVSSNLISENGSAIAPDSYLADLLKEVSLSPTLTQEKEKWEWLQELRDRTSSMVQKLSLPTRRDEEWRFTDLSPLLQQKFQVETSQLNIDIAPLILPEATKSRLVFVNGIYAPELSSVADLPDGLVVSNLAGLPSAYRDRVGNYLAKVEGAQEVFTALNTTGIADVAVVWVPKNLVVETPIHLLFISSNSGKPTISQPRCLVVAESGSAATLIEAFVAGGEVYFTNAVTEIWLAENAQVSHTRIQRESGGAFHIGKSAIAQSRDSRYTCNAISLGGKLSRHNLEIFQTGEQTETTLNGLTLIANEQLADTHSAINLTKPHGTTRQLHKCIVADKAHAVFNGKVFVPKTAQLTDAGQLNRNLLLSPKARVDTKPQLEITADNVKCSHGATVSQLDAEEVFYLQSRGLDENDARNLLINAFAAEIINKLPIPSLRETLYSAVNQMKR